jgi:hypothetical protein
MQNPTVDEKEVDEGATKGHDRFVVALQPVYKFRDASVVCNGSYLSRSLSLSQKAVWCLGDDAFACQLSASVVYNEVTSRELDLHPLSLRPRVVLTRGYI